MLLKDIAKITSGSTAPKDQFFSEKGLPFIRAGHLESLINTNNIDDLPRISEENERNLKLKKIEKGTILFAKSGMSSKKNRIYLCNSEAYIVNHLAAIKPDTGKVESSYLRYFLEWFQPSKLSNDQSYPSIRISDIGDIDINLPNKEFQQKIVKILDHATALINKRKAQIEALDQLTQSVFFEMFGDSLTNNKNFPTQPLSDIALVRSSKRVFVKELIDEGIPFYRGNEVSSLALEEDFSPTLFITKEHYNSLKKSSGVPKIGDLLLPSICPDGRVWRVEDNSPFYFKDGRVLWIHFTNNVVNTIYIQYALKDKLIRDYLNIASGTTFAELKIFSLKKIKLMIPPLDLQDKFASIVGEIKAQKKIMEMSLLEMQNNYNSIMQRAFKGELFTNEKVLNL